MPWEFKHGTVGRIVFKEGGRLLRSSVGVRSMSVRLRLKCVAGTGSEKSGGSLRSPVCVGNVSVSTCAGGTAFEKGGGM